MCFFIQALVYFYFILFCVCFFYCSLLFIYKHRKASWLINDGVCDGFTHTENSMRDNSTYGLNFRQKFRQTVIMTHQSRSPRRNKKKKRGSRRRCSAGGIESSLHCLVAQIVATEVSATPMVSFPLPCRSMNETERSSATHSLLTWQ